VGPTALLGVLGKKKCFKDNININNLAFNETAGTIIRDAVRRVKIFGPGIGHLNISTSFM